MFNTQYSLFKLKNPYFIAICSMCLSLGIISPVLAEYKKPSSTANDAPNASSTGVTATRGICRNFQDSLEEKADSGSLTALAPYAHVGHSASTNPTFAWYFPDPKPYPVIFTLFELGVTDENKATKIYEVELKNTSGIMTHSLPTERVNLIPEKDYMWQVTVICDRARPSENIFVTNLIKVVEADPTIATQIKDTNESDRRANIYAQAGLWYDALAEVATVQSDPQAQDFTVKLISQLAAIEEQDSDSSDVKNTDSHPENLKKIIEVLNTVNK